MKKDLSYGQGHTLQEALGHLYDRIQARIFTSFPHLRTDQNLEALLKRFESKSDELKEITTNPYLTITETLSSEEKVLLNLALSTYLAPHIVGIFPLVESVMNLAISSFGGIRSKQEGKFTPTYQTALYILAGTDVAQRLRLNYLLEPQHLFYKRGILAYPSQEVASDSPLMLTPEYLQLLSNGKAYQPQHSTSFPAQQITTGLEWDNLLLSEKVLAQIKEIEYWILHQSTIMEEWQLGKQLKKGYKAIFYGPSGTGKTLTTTLLGKSTGLPVYRTDMSAVVSKYIGETEKNLENLFKVAENKNWILFFDEAESLFAKRGAVKDASDQYANQTITYLLQRIEDYNGVVILATNKPTSIDDAFKRRFQNIVEFPKPN
ncbi:MAG: ATP-binding protein, partial [Thermonemataceae bacterium]